MEFQSIYKQCDLAEPDAMTFDTSNASKREAAYVIVSVVKVSALSIH